MFSEVCMFSIEGKADRPPSSVTEHTALAKG